MQGQYDLVDSDVLLTAKNRYYAFNICHDFWKNLLQHHQKGHIFGIARISDEFLRGCQNEEFSGWIRHKVLYSFFLGESVSEEIGVYKKIMIWIKEHPNYTEQALAESEDDWPVTFSQVHNAIVVANKKFAPDSKTRVKIPSLMSTIQCSAKRHIWNAEIHENEL